MYKNEEDKYVDFFKTIKKFNHLRDKQKQRGLNDYNILTSVLRASDEVRLHSRMIGSLINPNGVHYQGSLFLEIFLEILNFKNFDLDLKNVKVHIEYKDIDLYITDGIKHLIIENKIWAEDQPCQIIKYINIIKNEFNLEVNNSEKIPILDDIRVVYLTARDKNIPSEHLLDEKGYILFDDTLSEKLLFCSKKDNTKKYVPNGLNNYKVLYKKMSYKKDILEWLYKSKFEVQNITNLNEAIKQYISVVEIITKQYKSRVANMNDIILEDKENFVIASEITESFNKLRPIIVEEFFSKTLIDYFTNQFENNIDYEEYKITVNEKLLKDKHSYPIKVSHKYKEWKIVFQFGFGAKDMNKGYYGISKYDENVPLDDFRNNYPKLLHITKQSSWSILWEHTPRKYSYDIKNIIAFKFTPEAIAKEYFILFQNTMKKLEEYNITLDELNDELDQFILEQNQ